MDYIYIYMYISINHLHCVHCRDADETIMKSGRAKARPARPFATAMHVITLFWQKNFHELLALFYITLNVNVRYKIRRT